MLSEERIMQIADKHGYRFRTADEEGMTFDKHAVFDFARAIEAELLSGAGEDANPPFGSKRNAALALYRPPFRFLHGYIYDAAGHMVADQDGFEGKVAGSIAARVRGWGRISYMPDPEALQDEVGAILAEALNKFWADAALSTQEGQEGE